MLVISRRKNERFTLEIGGVVAVVTIGKIDGVKVKVRIDAPPEVSIAREEVATGAAVLAALAK
jgi:carbon storage regulator CsrA